MILFLLFILLQREDLRDRVLKLAGTRDLQRSTAAMTDAARASASSFSPPAHAQCRVRTGYRPRPSRDPVFRTRCCGACSPASCGSCRSWAVLSQRCSPSCWQHRSIPVGRWFLRRSPFPRNGAARRPGRRTARIRYEYWVFLLAIIVATIFWTLIWGPMGLLLATLTLCLVVLGNRMCLGSPC